MLDVLPERKKEEKYDIGFLFNAISPPSLHPGHYQKEDMHGIILLQQAEASDSSVDNISHDSATYASL